jgi:hypothetical protein
MNELYIIFWVSSLILSSLLTVLFINKKQIVAKATMMFSARKQQREKRFKLLVKQIVLDYLEELKNGKGNDIT